VDGGRRVVASTHERSRQESSSSNGAPSSEAFRSLVEGVGRGVCVGACVVRASSLAVQGSSSSSATGGRAWSSSS
jgi:hypothetical protein